MFDGSLKGGALDYAGFHTAAIDAQFARVRAASTTAVTCEGAVTGWLLTDMIRSPR